MLDGGTLGAVNAVDDLARIAAEMSRLDPEVRFLVVGSGREEARVRHTAAELGVLDRTFFMIGSLPKYEMADCLSAATVATSFVVDVEAMWLNSANKFFDALAARRPVMINHGGWQADLLTETGAGIAVSPRVPGGAARDLHRLLSSPERLARARCAADTLAAGRFDRDRLAAELLRVLERAREATARPGTIP